MTLAQADWDAARELCRALSEEFDPTEHRADPTKCNWCRPCAAALAEAREEGERIGAARERDEWLRLLGSKIATSARGPVEPVP